VLCFLFWQGSWQLLYHPASAITRTPAAADLDFQPIAFAPNDSGVPQLTGWWIPAAQNASYGRLTVLYLHGQDGDLSDAVEDLTLLHSIGLNVFAFDYRGYGRSQPAHPSEAHWLADAGFALTYLTQTRHIPSNAILVGGKNLGANLALEFAAGHSDLAGVIVDQPIDSPMDIVFSDPRAALVPAHLLVRDRYDSSAAASALRVPSLWFTAPEHSIEIRPSAAISQAAPRPASAPRAYDRITAPKTLVSSATHEAAGHDPAIAAQRSAALTRWLDDFSVVPAHR
jgi:pimeloyl-ACP methyl ester carboxylesterase